MKIQLALFQLYAAASLVGSVSAADFLRGGEQANDGTHTIVGGTEATPGRYSSGDCDTFANKVRIESTTGQQIPAFEVEVYPHLSWDNVAQGKSASQSSKVIMCNFGTLSYTSDQSAWWQMDLEDTYDVDLVRITNRNCDGWNDPKGCLCKLSYATVSLLDASGSVVSSRSLGDTCDEHDVFIEFGCKSTSYMPTYMPTSIF